MYAKQLEIVVGISYELPELQKYVAKESPTLTSICNTVECVCVDKEKGTIFFLEYYIEWDKCAVNTRVFGCICNTKSAITITLMIFSQGGLADRDVRLSGS